MTGLLLGVGIGLLLAPEKGEDTREALADTAESWKNKINRMVGRGGAQLDDLKKMLESEISGLSDDMRARISTMLDDAGATAGAAGAAYKDEFKPI